ncbi:MAG: pilus assembly protein PilM [Candidatus Berkelbacteria bacterium]|nr:pilus assembly protein PilM [Candidatus Berkelbacteria bacterium]MCR4307203.1 pilus assembly protein PilM [Candidatus Berkelbacteria bacterium]
MGQVVVGVDIGHETVKIASLEHLGKRFRLQGMHLANIPPGSWKIDKIDNVDEIAKTVDEAMRIAKPHSITTRKAMFALPESVIFSATLTMPDLPKDELEKALPFELAERLSINPDDYHIDYEKVSSKCKPIDQATASKLLDADSIKSAKEVPARPSTSNLPQITVFAAATRKTLVNSIVELCEKAHLELSGIDIKPGAIIRSVMPANDQKARIVVDMGVGGTGASVAEGQSLRVTSTVPWGTHTIAQTITAPVPDLRERLAPVFDELVHITKFFENRVCPGLKIEQLIVSGTGAGIPNVAEIIQKETGLPTTLAEPFRNVDTHHFPVPVELTHTFADAIGLAMRSAE